MFLSGGQTSDYVGARALVEELPKSRALIADRGYDADWFRNALKSMGIAPCIPARRGRKRPIPHDPDLYRPRHRIENSFARLKDWVRSLSRTDGDHDLTLATRYDSCPKVFISACALAAVVLFWL